MVSQSRLKLGGALAGALLVAAACGGTAPTKSPGAAATIAPATAGSTANATVPAATVAPTVAPTLAATVQGVKNGRIAYGLRSKAGTFNIFTGPIYDQSGALKVKDGEVIADADLAVMDWFVKGVATAS